MAINVTLARQPMTDGTTKLKLVTPYSPDLPAKCRALGGKWNATAKAWYFDERDANRVRSMCVEAFGIDPLADPDEAPDLVTVRYRVGGLMVGKEIWLFGRELANQPGRDARPRLGHDVVMVRGSFRGGGSVKNPDLRPTEDCEIEIRDVPRPLVEAELRSQAEQATRYRDSLAKKEAEIEEITAKIAAIEVPVEPGSVAMSNLHGLQRSLNTAQISMDNLKLMIETVGRLTLIESAAQPVERVNPATAQIGALFSSLAPESRRAVIMSMIASMPSSERPALIKDIRTFAEQGAI